MSKRVAVVLTDEALQIIGANSTERTRGDWVSGVIVAWATARQVAGAGVSERIEARLIQLEDAINRLH